MRLRSFHSVVVAVALMQAGTVIAQADYPSKPIRMIVPFAAGGSTDVIARLLSEKLTEAMDLLVADKELYQYCKQNTLQSIQYLSLENIGKQWLDLMKIKDFQVTN